MTGKQSSVRVSGWFWAALFAAANLAASLQLDAAEQWPENVPSHRLTDDESASDSSETKMASFRMNDRGAELAYPRTPGVLLSELADAVVTTGPTAKPGSPRPLPPVAANKATPTTPETPKTDLSKFEFGTPCPGCESCGSLDQLEKCKNCDLPGGCDTCGSQLACTCEVRKSREGLFQNTLVFLAGDAWKNNFDDDDNNNFGFRTGFNSGIDLFGFRGVRGQIGMSYGAYDLHGREERLGLSVGQSGLQIDRLGGDDPIEQQVFATAGVFKRSMISCDDRIAWGGVYDVMLGRGTGEFADSLLLSQARGYIGFALNERNEIGSWMAFRLKNDYATRQGVSVNVTDQANLFWHHTWQTGGDTTAYVGWADEPSNVVIGLNGRVPLNNHVALFGNVHYFIPSTTGGDMHPTITTVDDVFTQEAWNVSFGIVVYRGRKAISPDVSGYRTMPLLPVADNGSFSFQTDLR